MGERPHGVDGTRRRTGRRNALPDRLRGHASRLALSRPTAARQVGPGTGRPAGLVRFLLLQPRHQFWRKDRRCWHGFPAHLVPADHRNHHRGPASSRNGQPGFLDRHPHLDGGGNYDRHRRLRGIDPQFRHNPHPRCGPFLRDSDLDQQGAHPTLPCAGCDNLGYLDRHTRPAAVLSRPSRGVGPALDQRPTSPCVPRRRPRCALLHAFRLGADSSAYRDGDERSLRHPGILPCLWLVDAR